MSQPAMPQPAMPQPETAAPDCLFDTIVEFMLPFFLVGAGGNPDVARTAVLELIEAYNASSATELDLVGRIIGFSVAALDNLRLSMTPNLTDTMVLRYRSNAVTLSRASDRARTMLEAAQAGPGAAAETSPTVRCHATGGALPARGFTKAPTPGEIAVSPASGRMAHIARRRIRNPAGRYRDDEARGPHHDAAVFQAWDKKRCVDAGDPEPGRDQ